jgi:transcriptional regulator with XRE-family HTH domain
MPIFGNQIKAARALAGLDQRGLSDQSGGGLNTIRAMESAGAANMPGLARTLEKVVGALKSAGVTFVDEDGDGRGVRLRNGK